MMDLGERLDALAWLYSELDTAMRAAEDAGEANTADILSDLRSQTGRKMAVVEDRLRTAESTEDRAMRREYESIIM